MHLAGATALAACSAISLYQASRYYSECDRYCVHVGQVRAAGPASHLADLSYDDTTAAYVSADEAHEVGARAVPSGSEPAQWTSTTLLTEMNSYTATSLTSTGPRCRELADLVNSTAGTSKAANT